MQWWQGKVHFVLIWQQWLGRVCWLTLLLARCGVGTPEVEALGLTAFFCFSGADAGRLLPAGSEWFIQTFCCTNSLIGAGPTPPFIHDKGPQTWTVIRATHCTSYAK